MNVNAIRKGLAQVYLDAGWQATAYVPERLATFPAAIVGVPIEVDYGASLGLARIELPITVAFQIGTFEDAQESLDNALSTDDMATAVNLLRAEPQSSDWAKIHVLRADNVRMTEDADARSLAVDITIEVFARK